MSRLTNQEMIEAIKGNYPPANYTMLRETLDYCVKLLDLEEQGRLLEFPYISKLKIEKTKVRIRNEIRKYSLLCSKNSRDRKSVV